MDKEPAALAAALQDRQARLISAWDGSGVDDLLRTVFRLEASGERLAGEGAVTTTPVNPRGRSPAIYVRVAFESGAIDIRVDVNLLVLSRDEFWVDLLEWITWITHRKNAWPDVGKLTAQAIMAVLFGETTVRTEKRAFCFRWVHYETRFEDFELGHSSGEFSLKKTTAYSGGPLCSLENISLFRKQLGLGEAGDAKGG